MIEPLDIWMAILLVAAEGTPDVLMSRRVQGRLTGLDVREELDARRTIAYDGHGLVCVIKILGPIRGMYDIPLKTA